MNIKEALEFGIKKLKENNIQEPNLKVRLVLAYIMKQNKEYLITHYEEKIEDNINDKYIESIKKLCNNIPVQYIIKKQEFMGLELYVDESVLIPQPDTETLVEEVIDICKYQLKSNKSIQILDLCTGSGAIGISIAKNVKNSSLVLSDINTDVLKVTEKNCKNIIGEGNNLIIIQSDLFENINNKFDIIVSNPPYIKTEIIKTLDKEVQKEPKLALDGGKDGLEVYRKIIKDAYKYLNNNGLLCLEIGYDQKDDVIDLLKRSKKYIDIYSKKDLTGKDRIIVCKKEN